MFLIKPVYASCPVCIVTIGGGLFLAKKLGIDDLLVSIWLSGLNTAIAIWIASTMKNKMLKNPLLWSIGFYLITVWYLWYSKQIGHPKNTFYGIDKVFFGISAGYIVFLLSVGIDKLIGKSNQGKVLFYYQKVIIPVAMLGLATIFFKILLK